MTTPCTARRIGGPAHDRDIPCPEPATTAWDGQPVCEGHREAGERRAREGIAETLCEGVPLERLRAIAGAGGLSALLKLFAETRGMLASYRDFVGNTGWTCRDNRETCREFWEDAERVLNAAEAFRAKDHAEASPDRAKETP